MKDVLCLARRGFSLIELMVVLVIMGLLMTFALDQYTKDVEFTKRTRARMDLEELAKSVRLYNIREEKSFSVATFTQQALATFIGTYLESTPPLDPWGHPYKHKCELGILYSFGPDGRDGFDDPTATMSDDVVMRYLPDGFYMTKAEYVDLNRNNQIDFGDAIEVFFSRPAKFRGVSQFDFQTQDPAKALGSSMVNAASSGMSLQIVFSPTILPTLEMGKTKLLIRPYQEGIRDCSAEAVPPATDVAVIINRRKN